MRIFKTKNYHIVAIADGKYLTAGEDNLITAEQPNEGKAQLWKLLDAGYCLWARACSFAAVLGERTVTVYSGVALPVRQVLPRRAVTSVRLLRTPLLRLGGVSLLIVAAPGAKLFLPAIPAQQAGLLAHILAEDAP